jgi:hypothetical protein
MKRPLSLLAALVLFSVVRAGAAVLGVEQPEIKLSDGRVMTKAKIIDYSSTKKTAVITDESRILTVPLANLPADLREQLLTEPSRESRPRYNVYRDERSAITIPPPPEDKVTTPPPPVTAKDTAHTSLSSTDLLIEQAKTETADELKFYLIKSFNQVSSLTTKIRKAEQVSGWSKIRVSGEAAYSTWDNYRRDYTWRTGKFEVEFAIIDGRSLRIDTISFGGIPRQVDLDFDK